MIGNRTPTYENAERLRKNGNYQEACQQFAHLWQKSPGPRIGWRYAFCLRKLGRLSEAERVAQEALAEYPEDPFTRAELGWILYEKELKPAREKGDLERLVSIAHQILALNSDGLALARVVLAVMQVAKERRKWSLLLEWADQLTADQLDHQPKTIGDKRGMSDRAIWYIDRARALLELDRLDEAHRVAQNGLAEFPNDIFLQRISALALARSGDLTAGITTMRALLTHPHAHPHADWYMKAELAELEHQAGNHGEAYQLMCGALSDARQSDEYKLRYIVVLARIALALDRLEEAAAHIALAKAIRSEMHWPIPFDLIKLEKDVHAQLQARGRAWPELPQAPKPLSEVCHRYWRRGKEEGLQFYQGTVKPYPPARLFTFIQRDDGAEDVYVLIKDLPESCREPGSRVEFALTTGFDKKKGRTSVRATNIRRIKG
jgi:tetratricopeptide (TPR) repeat protein